MFTCSKSKIETEWSILGPLFFSLSVNDLPNASLVLGSTMFADDANLFCFHSDIGTLFSKVNIELEKISECFKANKLPLNIKKITISQKQY